MDAKIKDKCAKRIAYQLLDRGLGHSTWRSAHPVAYDDLVKNYTADIVADIGTMLQTLRLEQAP